MKDATKKTPVIAIDGPTASGKGAVSMRVAAALGFHCLDSGALYRLVALASLRYDVSPDDSAALAELVNGLAITFPGLSHRPAGGVVPPRRTGVLSSSSRLASVAVRKACFREGCVTLDGRDVLAELRIEAVGNRASVIAANPVIRAALVARQRAFCLPPGLVAEGRDMGTVIFPDADLKVFLTATVEARAERRYKQLMEKGFPASMPDLLRNLRERDARDSQRAAAPLKPAKDAKMLDTSALSVGETVNQVLSWFAASQGKQSAIGQRQ